MFYAVVYSAAHIKVNFYFVYVKGYPFKPNKQRNLDYVRQFPHLRPRTLFFGALLRIRNAAAMAVHKYFQVCGNRDLSHKSQYCLTCIAFRVTLDWVASPKGTHFLLPN